MKAFPLLILWFLLAIVVGLAAKSSGRSFLLWLLISLVASPILGFLLLHATKGK
ncbi:MAG: hypothetical protein QHC78_20610 [Pigmentiphaga sp.]|uniref:hypothetical protein n=1 Tax=Alcaligenaceae TaxID=506 RepID=UPI0006BECCF6|nr:MULTISPECIES: hypothetical protein [Alcaligenaceae]MDX3908097.1 hypothetical protein [Pigmentiphaga sp.]CUI86762.1 Uncharacterised protein [Achromobacter dolens]